MFSVLNTLYIWIFYDMQTLPKTHIIYTSHADIDKICAPLKKCFDLTLFHYFKRHKNSVLDLSNNVSWTQHFYNQYLNKTAYRANALDVSKQNYQDGYLIYSTSLDKSNAVWNDASINFNIDHGIVLVEPGVDSCEFFCFGTEPKNPHMLNYYLNHLDYLRRFTLYFKDKASTFITKAEKTKIFLPEFSEPIFPLQQNTDKKLLRTFMEETKVNHFKLKINATDITVTRRELDCIIYLFENKSAKQIAKILGLSFRTIENNINNLKIKLNCSTVSELINILLIHYPHFIKSRLLF